MPVNVTSIDNKFKTKKQKDMQRQREFDDMERNPSRLAMERFRAVPYQLTYANKYGENRTK